MDTCFFFLKPSTFSPIKLDHNITYYVIKCRLLVCMWMFLPSICWCNCLNVLYNLYASLSCICEYVMLSNIGGNKISISRQINILTSVVSRALHYMIGSPDCGRLFPAYSADRVSFAAGLAAVKHAPIRISIFWPIE